jgi:Tol biopolymer transport system component
VGFSPDGQFLAFNVAGSRISLDMWVLANLLARAGASKPAPLVPLVRSGSLEIDPQFSPDGKWIAGRG